MFEAGVLADAGFQMLHAPLFRHGGHLGEGHEAAHAVPVHHKAALVVLDDARREFGVFILQVNEILPDLLFLGLVVGEKRPFRRGRGC